MKTKNNWCFSFNNIYKQELLFPNLQSTVYILMVWGIAYLERHLWAACQMADKKIRWRQNCYSCTSKMTLPTLTNCREFQRMMEWLNVYRIKWDTFNAQPSYMTKIFHISALIGTCITHRYKCHKSITTQLGQLFHKSHIHTFFLSQTIDILDYVNGIGNGCIFAQSTPLLLVGTETSILTAPISF